RTTRVNEGQERKRSSSSVTDVAARGRAEGDGVSRGSIAVTKLSGTSHTPVLIRTGPSSSTGRPSTRIWAQFRVNVTTLRGVRMLVRVASVATSGRGHRIWAIRLSWE